MNRELLREAVQSAGLIRGESIKGKYTKEQIYKALEELSKEKIVNKINGIVTESISCKPNGNIGEEVEWYELDEDMLKKIYKMNRFGEDI